MSHESLRFPLHWKYYALLGKAPFITSMLFVARDVMDEKEQCLKYGIIQAGNIVEDHWRDNKAILKIFMS